MACFWTVEVETFRTLKPLEPVYWRMADTRESQRDRPDDPASAEESESADRVVVSYPADLSDWGQFQVEILVPCVPPEDERSGARRRCLGGVCRRRLLWEHPRRPASGRTNRRRQSNRRGDGDRVRGSRRLRRRGILERPEQGGAESLLTTVRREAAPFSPADTERSPRRRRPTVGLRREPPRTVPLARSSPRRR